MNVLGDKEYKQFSDLDPEELDRFNFSVYVLDKNWCYLFVNDFAVRNLGDRGKNLIGQNMWTTFPELASDPAFLTLRQNTENGKNTNTVTTSPVTSQRLAIMGKLLSDCTLFTSTILPKKEELLHELRDTLSGRKG